VDWDELPGSGRVINCRLEVIHKIIGMAVYIGFGFEYYRDRNRVKVFDTAD